MDITEARCNGVMYSTIHKRLVILEIQAGIREREFIKITFFELQYFSALCDRAKYNFSSPFDDENQ